MNFLSKLFKARTTDVKFDKVMSTKKATLENQDGRIEDFGHSQIIEYIQKIIDDNQQFVTLELAEVHYGISYIQACVNNEKINVQLGLEEGDHTKLVEKMCSEEECQNIFIEFYDFGYTNIEGYKPVEFFQ